MYRILLLLIFFCLGKTLSAQHVYTIKADYFARLFSVNLSGTGSYPSTFDIRKYDPTGGTTRYCSYWISPYITTTGQLTTNFGGASLAAFNSVTTTLPVAGAQPGDVVNVSANTGAVNQPSITISAYVTTANTVTLRAYNAGNSAVTIASDTYKVRVIR